MDFVKRESYEHRIDNIVILFPFNQIYFVLKVSN